MTEATYYKISLALPVAVPVLGSAALMGAGEHKSWFGQTIDFLAFAIVIGGVPYLVFCGLMFEYFRSNPGVSYFAASLVAPLIFAAILGVGVVAYGLLVGELSAIVPGIGFYGAFSVATGYFYVGLCHAIRFALRCAGIIRVPEAAG